MHAEEGRRDMGGLKQGDSLKAGGRSHRFLYLPALLLHIHNAQNKDCQVIKTLKKLSIESLK